MRAGELSKRATVLALSPDQVPVTVGQRWVGIRTKEAADVRAADGLRVAALVEVRARFSDCLVPGRYLIHGGRLLHVTSARDFRGDRAELVMSCEELVGEPGEYRPQGGRPVPARIFLRHISPFVDENDRLTDYRLQAEVALVETGRVQLDDQLVIGEAVYNVIGYVDGSDDGVVRSLWLEAQ
ncbi:hypothetical protein SA496_01220 [Pseudomonas sp. JS3066]|uniref:hypothetical protein n=1 Tax=Pseudomonas sp. JS3066 TaxID=3090665 RepID=UPI002E7BF49F|nr:hypothetical protein [Pseudomonas sp. JS3066]WVK93836.1 hypothetical protein SA496_01220 [Pseudomonas sp. JS3066]